MKPIKILYFFPYTIVNKNHGNVTRAIQLLEYFRLRENKISIDFVTEEHNYIEQENVRLENLFPGLRSFFLRRKRDKSNRLKYLIQGKIPFLIDKKRQKKYHTYIKSQASLFAKQQFNEILKATHYDVIIISYVFWASLVRNNPYTGQAKLVIDTHDLITGQYKDQEGFQLGATFEEEIKILNRFDETWSLSFDELYLFSQFASNTKHLFAPVMFKSNIALNKREILYDLIYVASDNPSNQVAAQWFFSKVYPLLPGGLKICVIGGIVASVPDLPNVEKISFAEDLGVYYSDAKIAICPMLSGTGIKVKVVEALSFGLPVVCTLRGLDGLPIKKHNGCLMAEDEAAFTDHINSLISNTDIYNQVQKEGIKMFEEYFEITKGHKTFDKIFGII